MMSNADACPERQSFRLQAPDRALMLGGALQPGMDQMNDSRREVSGQAAAWLDAGTRMVLVVDPRRRTATVYSPDEEAKVLSEEDFVEGGEVVPGWRVRVKEFFT